MRTTKWNAPELPGHLYGAGWAGKGKLHLPCLLPLKLVKRQRSRYRDGYSVRNSVSLITMVLMSQEQLRFINMIIQM